MLGVAVDHFMQNNESVTQEIDQINRPIDRPRDELTSGPFDSVQMEHIAGATQLPLSEKIFIATPNRISFRTHNTDHWRGVNPPGLGLVGSLDAHISIYGESSPSEEWLRVRIIL